MSVIERFIHSEEGATMVEYALMVALIALVVFGAVVAVGVNTSATFANPELNANLT